MPPSPRSEYAQRLDDAQKEQATLDRAGAAWANVRGLLFLSGAVLAVLPLFGKLPRSAWWGAAACFALYAVAAALHARVLAREERTRLRAAQNARGLARLDGAW